MASGYLMSQGGTRSEEPRGSLTVDGFSFPLAAVNSTTGSTTGGWAYEVKQRVLHTIVVRPRQARGAVLRDPATTSSGTESAFTAGDLRAGGGT